MSLSLECGISSGGNGINSFLRIICSETYPSFLTLKEVFSKIIPSFFTIKEGSTFLTKPLFPQGREDVTALRCSEPLRSKVGGPKRSSPDCAGCDRRGNSSL